MSTLEELKNDIIDSLEYLSENQLQYISDLLKTKGYTTKTDLLKLSGFDMSKTFDTAYPIDYFRRIEEIFPKIQDGNLIYDYSEKSFGELVNVNDLFVKQYINFLQDRI